MQLLLQNARTQNSGYVKDSGHGVAVANVMLQIVRKLAENAQVKKYTVKIHPC